MRLDTEFGNKTIDDIILLYQHGRLNLEPGFQRKSVWSLTDRKRLIESILSGQPIPGIFLYRRNQDGHVVYDVIDGKQRLETILMFTRQKGFARQGFDVSANFGVRTEKTDWTKLLRKHSDFASGLRGFKIQTIELTGDLSSIVDVFVRINSTGKPLTSGEKRHARFYNSPFLKEAERLVNRNRDFLTGQKILSEAQLSRMKGTELFSELLISIHQGGIINKKLALDRAIGNHQLSGRDLTRISKEFTATLNSLRKLVPSIQSLRFRNVVEFYTLFMIVWEARSAHLILSDTRNNKVALGFLTQLSNGVDDLQQKLKRARPAEASDQLFTEYLLTVQGNTDSAPIRMRRAEIVRGLVFPLFEKKDDKRLFSIEQRRLLWNKSDDQKCPNCRKLLRWDEITVDHVIAYAKGGKTNLNNAQMLCQSCNSRKGNR